MTVRNASLLGTEAVGRGHVFVWLRPGIVRVLQLTWGVLQ